MPPPADKRAEALAERRRRYRRGHVSEFIAAFALMARGYRILGRRVRTPYGEIDLVAVRWRRLAFVEVKRRNTRAEAEAALTRHQARRLADAAEHWLARRPSYREHTMAFDAVLVLPWHLPVHLADALQP
jgi:putative endonuclease